jgi:hypothetical protein
MVGGFAKLFSQGVRVSMQKVVSPLDLKGVACVLRKHRSTESPGAPDTLPKSHAMCIGRHPDHLAITGAGWSQTLQRPHVVHAVVLKLRWDLPSPSLLRRA